LIAARFAVAMGGGMNGRHPAQPQQLIEATTSRADRPMRFLGACLPELASSPWSNPQIWILAMFVKGGGRGGRPLRAADRPDEHK
jgi:hypothetical protein